MNSVCNSPSVVGSYRAELGETPVWCWCSQSLLWVDILRGCLLRYWPEQEGRMDIHPMPTFTSAVLLTDQSETFLVVSQCGIQIYDYTNRRFAPFHPWPERDTRPNEAAIAPDGALWFSTMAPNADRAIGSLYRLDPRTAELQRLLMAQWVPNTLLWADHHLWFADSLRQMFYRATFDGCVLNIAQHYPMDGIPDGSTLTCENQLINARWGAYCLVRYKLLNNEMHELERVRVPVRQPSSCTFGGPELNELYITSARCALARPDAMDGALLKMATTLTGTPASQFRLKNYP
ncbi:SMP-30/gluconolactonase/LRE family protein [Serratia fonticola]|uniref:SMP-30/gluconolactonase/LRE family protein n=1 Tax=Serratia fonticola TaxID=47917 RepID=UPI003BB7A9BC